MAQGAKEEAAKEEGSSFRPEEIDQMVAPIALYPDSLLAQDPRGIDVPPLRCAGGAVRSAEQGSQG